MADLGTVSFRDYGILGESLVGYDGHCDRYKGKSVDDHKYNNCWAARREYPSEYIKNYPDVISKLLHIDNISARLTDQYKELFLSRTCHNPEWKKELSETEMAVRNVNDLNEILKTSTHAKYELAQAQEDVYASLTSHEQACDNMFTGVLGFVDLKEACKDLVGRLRKDVNKAVQNESDQISYIQWSAVETVNATKDGPAGLGVSILHDRWAAFIKDTEEIIKMSEFAKLDTPEARIKKMVIEKKYDQHLIYDVAQYGPAYEAGIKTGDRIIEIDGKNTFAMSGEMILDELRGACDKPVELLIERDGVRAKYSVNRGVADVPSKWFSNMVAAIPTAFPRELFLAK